MQDSSGNEMEVDDARPRRIMTAAQKAAATRLRNRALQEEADMRMLAQTGGHLMLSRPVSLNVVVKMDVSELQSKRQKTKPVCTLTINSSMLFSLIHRKKSGHRRLTRESYRPQSCRVGLSKSKNHKHSLALESQSHTVRFLSHNELFLTVL